MEEIIKSLNEFLSDLEIFNVKLQNYHWNVIGKEFFITHGKLEEYYDEIREQIESIQDRIVCKRLSIYIKGWHECQNGDWHNP